MKRNLAMFALLTLVHCYLINAADTDSQAESENWKTRQEGDLTFFPADNNPYIALGEKKVTTCCAARQFWNGMLLIHTLSKSEEKPLATSESVQALFKGPSPHPQVPRTVKELFKEESTCPSDTPEEETMIKHTLYEINKLLNKSPEPSENEDPVNCRLVWLTPHYVSRARFTLPNPNDISKTPIKNEKNKRFICLMLTDDSEISLHIEDDIEGDRKGNGSRLMSHAKKIFSEMPDSQDGLLMIDRRVATELRFQHMVSDDEPVIKPKVSKPSQTACTNPNKCPLS